MKNCGVFILLTVASGFLFSTCLSGMPVGTFIRPPNIGRCMVDSDCSHINTCHKNICTDPCNIRNGIKDKNKCGMNAKCIIMGDHTAICECPVGTRGDPYYKCEKIKDGIDGKLWDQFPFRM